MFDKTVSEHADLLNDLCDMQGSYLCALRRPVLEKAENLIVAQEQKLVKVMASNADLLAICKSVLFALELEKTRALKDYEDAYVALRGVLQAAIAKAEGQPTPESKKGE